MRKLLLFFLFATICYLPLHVCAQIASWDFTGQNQLATSTANSSDPGLASVPVLTRGTGAAASAGANSFRTVGFQNNGISTANTDYFQVTLTAATGKRLSLSSIDAKFAGTASFYASPGVSSQFAYSLDGTNFTLIGTPATILAASLSSSTNLSGVTDLQNIPAGTTVTLRYYASGQTTTGGWGFNSSSSGTNGFSISGTLSNVSTGTPTLNANPTALAFGSLNTGSTTTAQTYVLNGNNLTAAVSVTTVAPFAVSKDGTTFSSSISYTAVEAAASPTVYVRFSPTAGGPANGTVVNSSTGAADVSVSVSGTGISGTVNASKASLDFGNQNTGTNSASQSYILSGTGLSNDVTVSTSAPFSVSKDNTTFSQSITYTTTEVGSSPTVYVRFSPTSAVTSTDNVLNVSTNANSATLALSGTGVTPPAPQAHVVISEVYGGGGNSGATYKNDFIELYNPGNAAVDLTGWSVQYASATGTGNWQATPLSGSIPAKSFYLIQQAAGAGGTTNLPTPDAVGTLALSGTAGKVLLANTTAIQTGIKPTGSQIIDLVGFGTANGFEGTGPTPATTNTTSIERKATATSTATTLAAGGTEEFAGNGYDTDNNNTDFVAQTPNPQNSTVMEPTGANHVVISEVYGGGGNSGATYKNDFIELYNPTNADISLTGWSVQYASATGTGNWSTTALSGTIKAKGFYLVQGAAGAGGTQNLPTPDATGSLNLSGTAGKVALSNSTTALTGANPTGTNIVDLVGYGTANGYEGSGPAPATTNSTSAERKANAASTAATMAIGGTDEFAGNGFDSDDNSIDFVVSTPNPQNSTVTEPVSSSAASISVTPTSLAFGSQAINTVSTAKTYTLAGANLTNNVSISVNAPFSISKDNAIFSNSTSFTAAEAMAGQTLYVKFSPTAIGNAAVQLAHSSAGATTVNLALSGAGVDPNQTVFNFENCTTAGSSALSDGFYQYSVAGAQTWGCVTTFGHDPSDATGKASTGNALQINGYAGGNIQNEDWLISPALNLSAMNYAVLSFWTRSAFAGDKLKLKISTNYTGSGNPSAATWVDLDGKFPETATDTWTKSDFIDLTPYKAAPVYVAFVYTSTTSSASRWTVDDFAVNNSATPPPVDITVSPSSLSFGFQAAGTTSAESTFGFSAGNLTGDVTLTAPANFTISKTSGGTFGSTLTYTQASINNTSQTVYAKFSPTAVNTTYNGNVTIATPGSANKSVALSGNTFDIANTLEVVNWNIEWFGSPAQAPNDDQLQATNVRTVVNSLGADIYGFAEVVDTALFRTKVLPAGYGVIFSEFGSYADNKSDPDYTLAQKLAFMYRTDIIKPLRTYGVLQDTYNPAVPSTSVDGTPYKNWSSGRFPFAMEAEVTINGKKDTVTFIEIHAKANTGTTADQIDAYNRRKGGNLQFKTWLDANLAGKKVLILGDFNDVLDADKTIAPMPAGTGTSYSDFTNDVANYFPITLPLSLAGKQSTAGFPTVIDNVIITKALNVNYIPGTAEVIDGAKNLVTNYANTTTDHYPIKSRYLFGNGAPTLNTITDQTICYSQSNQTVALTGISAGPETSQTTTLAVTTDNANLFDVLSAQTTSADKGTVTYHLKNNVSGTANITVKVMDNGGTDFGGVDNVSRTFKLTVNSLATATIAGTATTVVNATAPVITFTGANGTAPYTFTYNLNGGTNQTITTTSGNSVTLNASTAVAGTFNYNLVSVSDANCSQAQTGTATIVVNPLPVGNISGTTAVCQNATAPNVTFTATVGIAPFTFTYNINGGTNKTVTTTSGNSVTVAAPTTATGTFAYNLVSIADANASQAQTGTATVTVRTLATASISGTTAVTVNATAPVITFTGANGTAPYTFTYNINGGTNKTVTTTSGNSVTVAVTTNAAGTFAYNLVNVSDANCGQAQTGTATVIVRPLPTATIAGNGQVCLNGASPVVTFTSAAGTAPYTFTYTVNGGANRTITSNNTTATLNVPTNTAGTFVYTLVSVADAYANQAQSGTATVIINALPALVITSNTSSAVISKGTAIVLSASGANTYTWSPQTDVIAGQGSANLTIRPKQTTTYTVTGTNASGCTTTQSITIQVQDDYQVKALNIMSPNGDGKNDKFVIQNIDYYPNNTLTIFDRSGRKVYTKKGYANEWDGTYNGTPLASDTYYYILEFGTNIAPFKGYITIVRN
ncbi:lamin tail domain-containing protein [Pedobacter sp. ASV12]|uniref:lamin tail domain-containing protein n=1 Tax=Pedobacter sp. ASV12 TaxID=2795120 RepID=UPI0018EBD8D6|nr:lamin tail domain-containing protein [Pedobacter sp. ASV12]